MDSIKQNRFTETQIGSILKRQEAGRTTKDICRYHSIGETASKVNWKASKQIANPSLPQKTRNHVQIKKQPNNTSSQSGVDQVLQRCHWLYREAVPDAYLFFDLYK